MKKHISLTLTLALCLGLTAGCSAKTAAPAASEAQTAAPAASEAQTSAPAASEATTAENTAAGPKTIESLKIAFSPYADSDTITTATEPLENLLKETLLTKGYDVQDVDMTVGTSYTAVGQALSAGSADIGFISGGNYVLFSEDCDVLLTALRYAINKDSENPADWNDGTIEENTKDMSTYYRSILLAGPSEKGQALIKKVNAGEELTWDDLNDATWAVMGPTSASGYIYPCLWLKERYGKGINDLQNVVQSDSYTTSLARLASGQADIMVSYGHIRTKYAPDWKEKFGGTDEMVNQTGVIGVTEGIYNDMIAYSKTSELMQDEEFRKALGDSFIEIAGTEEGKEIISVFSQVGYEWGDDANYDGERAAQELLKSMEK
ncbi:MAG: PhnD/SsuA/transferrin family substrate-binding protein [Lachnospiraceae bacterium]|nr:PhnD/SsuA/transferrin family substrate-binding protein [Lachnospiraceae bacterium]